MVGLSSAPLPAGPDWQKDYAVPFAGIPVAPPLATCNLSPLHPRAGREAKERAGQEADS